MSASTWIPIFVSIGALGVAVWARIEGLLERKHRQEEAQELRRQIARSEAAELGARQQQAKRSANVDTYVFTIENAGPAIAQDVTARVVEVDPETEIADVVCTEHVKTAIGVGRDVSITMQVPSALRDKRLELRADWTDYRGRRSDEWLLHLHPPKAARAASF
jgi:hypothetical protein